MSDAVFQVTSAKDITIRPLDKGMILNVPTQDVPDGGFLNIKDFIACSEGLRRAPGTILFGKDETYKYVLNDLVVAWTTAGVMRLILITLDNIYIVDPATGGVELAWAYSTGTVSVNGKVVTGSGTGWATDANYIRSGDIFRCGALESKIDTIGSNTSLSLIDDLGTVAAGAAYSIQRSFSGGYASQPGFDFINDLMIVADGKHPLLKYDPTAGTFGFLTTDVSKKIMPTKTTIYSTGTAAVNGTTGVVTGTGTSFTAAGLLVGDTYRTTINGFEYTDTIKSIDSNTQLTLDNAGTIPTVTAQSYLITRMVGVDLIPNVVASFLGMVWVGCTYDSVDGRKKQRIRWSTRSDPSDFSLSTSYYDIPYTSTELLRLVPLGEYLIAYFGDTIYKGVQTNYPLAPLEFQRIETGGTGLVGPKAVVSWLGAHFYVGQDDIYMLTTDGPHAIGTPVIRKALANTKNLDQIKVQVDAVRHRILVGIPGNANYSELVWSYDYQAKAWSTESINTTMIANPVISNTVSWASLAGITWANLSTYYPTWASMSQNQKIRQIYYEASGKLYVTNDLTALRRGTIQINPTFETKDYDLEAPEMTKVFTGFGFKVSYNGTVIPESEDPIIALVEISTNRGRSWKRCGYMRILAGSDEGWVSFRSGGSTARFRVTITSEPLSGQYVIVEHSLRVRAAGNELKNLGYRA